MRALICPMLLAALLWGCATPVEPISWFLDRNPEEGVKLTLGVPNSDDLRLMALCRPHSGVIRLTIFGRHGDPPVVELRSGKLLARYPGAGVEYDEENLVAAELQFELHADDPVLARVADTGELEITLGRRLVIPNGFAQEHDFIMACRNH
jgi:hypothetical protein